MLKKLTPETRWKAGKGYHKYCYTNQDFAELFGVSVEYVRLLVHKGKFDPNSLDSIFRHYLTSKMGKSIMFREGTHYKPEKSKENDYNKKEVPTERWQGIMPSKVGVSPIKETIYEHTAEA